MSDTVNQNQLVQEMEVVSLVEEMEKEAVALTRRMKMVEADFILERYTKFMGSLAWAPGWMANLLDTELPSSLSPKLVVAAWKKKNPEDKKKK